MPRRFRSGSLPLCRAGKFSSRHGRRGTNAVPVTNFVKCCCERLKNSHKDVEYSPAPATVLPDCSGSVWDSNSRNVLLNQKKFERTVS